MSKTRKMSLSFVKSQKLGRCSINDIIKDDSMDIHEKINYIRHHYTYYDGSDEVFFNNGIPNLNRFLLNDIIYRVITGKFLPEILNIINRAIRRWMMSGKEGVFDLKSVLSEYYYIV